MQHNPHAPTPTPTPTPTQALTQALYCVCTPADFIHHGCTCPGPPVSGVAVAFQSGFSAQHALELELNERQCMRMTSLASASGSLRGLQHPKVPTSSLRKATVAASPCCGGDDRGRGPAYLPRVGTQSPPALEGPARDRFKTEPDGRWRRAIPPPKGQEQDLERLSMPRRDERKAFLRLRLAARPRSGCGLPRRLFCLPAMPAARGSRQHHPIGQRKRPLADTSWEPRLPSSPVAHCVRTVSTI